GSLRHFRKDHELETVVSRFVVPILAQKTRKDGAPSSEEATTSPAEALRAELEKKDAEIKRLARENDQLRMQTASSSEPWVGESRRQGRRETRVGGRGGQGAGGTGCGAGGGVRGGGRVAGPGLTAFGWKEGA